MFRNSNYIDREAWQDGGLWRTLGTYKIRTKMGKGSWRKNKIERKWMERTKRWGGTSGQGLDGNGNEQGRGKGEGGKREGRKREGREDESSRKQEGKSVMQRDGVHVWKEGGRGQREERGIHCSFNRRQSCGEKKPLTQLF